MYGGSNASYSIGIAAHYTFAPGWMTPNRPFHLIKVIYDEGQQKEIVQGVVKVLVDFVSQNHKQNDIHKFVSAFRRILPEFILSLKHPSFSPEEEWRMICLVGRDDQGEKFRPSAFGLTPYVDLQLRMPAGPWRGKMPLKQVFVGPSAYSDLAVDSTRAFLKSTGYGWVDVHPSGLPLRTNI
ncbi:MAG: DUF2971 domain-containing protein [Microvirga sp.]